MNSAKRINSLTSLRFFAAFAVVVGHAGDYLQFSGYKLPYIALNKSHAVSFFFVLSGFILSYVYKNFNNLYDCWRFFSARIARILPVHLVTLFICLVAFWPDINAANIENVGQTFAFNTMLLHSWIPNVNYYFSFNYVSWSISTELGFYLSFPLLVILQNKYGPSFIILPLIPLIAILLYCVNNNTPISGMGVDMSGLIYISPLSRLLEFSTGILACSLFEKMQRKDSKIFNSSIPGVIGLSVCFISPHLVNFIGVFFQRINLMPISLYLYQNGMGIFFAFTIVMLALGNGALDKILCCKVLIWLGEISFSLYMVHQLIVRYINRNLTELSSQYPEHMFWAYIISSIVFAAITYHLVEVPSREAIKRLTARMAYQLNKA